MGVIINSAINNTDTVIAVWIVTAKQKATPTACNGQVNSSLKTSCNCKSLRCNTCRLYRTGPWPWTQCTNMHGLVAQVVPLSDLTSLSHSLFRGGARIVRCYGTGPGAGLRPSRLSSGAKYACTKLSFIAGFPPLTFSSADQRGISASKRYLAGYIRLKRLIAP